MHKAPPSNGSRLPLGTPSNWGRIALLIAATALATGAAPPSQAELYVGFVAAVRGKVDLQQGGESIWLPATIDSEVHVGDTVRTNLDAAVKIVLVDDTVLGLGEDTELTVDNFVIGPAALEEASVLRQLRGQMRTRVGEAFGGTTRIEVHTPTAIMGVKGTEGTTRVDYAPDEDGQAAAGGVSTLIRNWEGGITAARPGFGAVPVPPGQCRVVYLDRVGLPTECPEDFFPVEFEPPIAFVPARPESELVLGEQPPEVSAAIEVTGVTEAVLEALLVEPPDPVVEDRSDAVAISREDVNPLADLDFGSGEVGSNPDRNPIGGIDFGSGEVGSDPIE